MAAVLKISEAVSLAMHTAGIMAREPSRVISVREIAGELGASEAHLSKVMQRLAKAGLAVSDRGPKGGFRLARRPDRVTLLDVYEAIEGPLSPSACLLARPLCNGRCMLGDLLDKVNRSVLEVFSGTRLSHLGETLPWRNKNEARAEHHRN